MLNLCLNAICVKYLYRFCWITSETYSNSLSGNYPYTMERSKNLTGILKKFQHICSILRFFSDTLSLQTQSRAHH